MQLFDESRLLKSLKLATKNIELASLFTPLKNLFTNKLTLPLGAKIVSREGANGSSGVVTLVAGTATVLTNKINANSRVILSRQAAGVGVLGDLSRGTVVNGTSFVINSSANTDVSTIFWMIVDNQ